MPREAQLKGQLGQRKNDIGICHSLINCKYWIINKEWNNKYALLNVQNSLNHWPIWLIREIKPHDGLGDTKWLHETSNQLIDETTPTHHTTFTAPHMIYLSRDSH